MVPSDRKKPWYQKVLTSYITWVAAGFLAVGSILDTVSNTIDLITPLVTYAGTVLAVLALLALQMFLRRSSLLLITDDGQRTYPKRLGLTPHFALLGVILALWIPRVAQMSRPAPADQLAIEKIRISSRGPAWDWEVLDTDEIVVSVTGAGSFNSTQNASAEIIAFWRLANQSVWQVGKRRTLRNYELATLSTVHTATANWEFVIGGIECEKSYSGDVEIVLLLMEHDAVKSDQDRWMASTRSTYWGLDSLPTEGVKQASQISTFMTHSVR